MKTLLLIFLFVCYIPLTSMAQEDMETDRPGKSTTAYTTVKKSFLFEVGYNKVFDKIDGEKQQEYLYPTTWTRYGLTKKIELRLLMEIEGDYKFTPLKQKTAGGLKPVELGFKYNFIKEKGWLPQTSLMVNAGIPKWASKDFEGNFVVPEFILLMQNSLTEKLSLTYNVGVIWEADDVHAKYLYTFTPQLEILEKLKIFTEIYGLLSPIEHPVHRWDAGMSYLVKPNLQIDFSAGSGFNKNLPNSFFEFGVSFRVPR